MIRDPLRIAAAIVAAMTACFCQVARGTEVAPDRHVGTAGGRPIAIAVFPHAEHGLYEYETRDDGERLSTRQPDGYLSMMIDVIRTGRLKPRYGTAVLQR